MTRMIGPYEVLREIGRGGMGVVSLGRDTRLDRDVAIKELPEHLASEPARLERFEREARLLAGLNHPNIAGIHGVEKQGGATYLVLEYVDGETLADRLDRGPLPIDEAIEHAIQIAAAIEAAHDAGVIHRDLKPANIRITPDGVAKVLDFGLARAEESGSLSGALDSPTLTAPHPRHSPTIEGAILGTAAYMSPEQARGRRVDKRTDVWSFGVVLFEMLVGASPFHGETASDSIGAVLHKELDLDRLPPSTPARVRRVLERCLRRDRAQRYRDVGDARLDLLEPEETTGDVRRSRSRVPWAITAIALLLASGAIAFGVLRTVGSNTPPDSDRRVVRFRFDIPFSGESFTSSSAIAISDDGATVAVQADLDGADPIYVRSLDQHALRRVETPWDEEPELLRWSRDGRWLIVRTGSVQSGELWKVSPFGEAPRLICPLPGEGFLWADSVDYLDDDTLIVGMAVGGLWTVPERGGRMRRHLAPAREGEILVQPRPIPGSDALLFLEIAGGTLDVLEDGERRTLFDFEGDRLRGFALAPDGSLLCSVFDGARARGTYRLSLDLDRLEIAGDPVLDFPLGDVDVSDDGTLVFSPVVRSAPTMRELVWVERDGTIDETIARDLPNARDASLSPDGRRAAISIISAATLDSDAFDHDIAIVDLASGGRYELASDEGNEYAPFWSPDGESVFSTTYSSGVRRSSRRAASGTGAPETVFARSLIARPSDDGRFVVSSIDRMTYLEGDATEPVTFGDLRTTQFDLTSDSRFLAYTPDGGAKGIRIQRFPEGGALTNVTTMDAHGLNWGPDDTRLYFWSEGTFWEVPIDVTGTQPVPGTPTALFSAAETRLVDSRVYGIDTDGRFLMLRDPEDRPAPIERIAATVVRNWIVERARD